MPIPISVDHVAALTDEVDVDLVALGVRAGRFDDDAPGLDAQVATIAGFEGKVAQTLLTTTDAGVRLLVGLGESPDPAQYRKVGAAVSKAAIKGRSVAVDALSDLDGTDRAAAAEALAEGLALGAYGFADYKDPAPGTALEAATVVGKGGKRVTDAVSRGLAIATAVGLARDLVNTPGGDLTPPVFADQAVELAAEFGLEVEVLELEAIREHNMGGLLGVARGSYQEPRFVTLTYRPEGKPRGKVALVGKGLTFDSGGLSIKPGTAMFGMKNDMGGAAAVVAAMTLVPLVAPKLEVTAYIPMTDNMLGPDATRPGDVLRTRSGTTIEVVNTDAEGRLILADALTMAVEGGADAIIDLATLTGACLVALGDRTAGLMSNHDALNERVLDAAKSAGELVWPLPLPEHLRKTIDSDIADLRNMGTTQWGGSLTAGLFLKEFVGDVPWAHLDIAGPADASAAYDEVGKGGTGFGVRTLARLLASWSKLPTD
jgi:leucyl aminopeptidase